MTVIELMRTAKRGTVFNFKDQYDTRLFFDTCHNFPFGRCPKEIENAEVAEFEASPIYGGKKACMTVSVRLPKR
jgi:hypothetical protein